MLSRNPRVTTPKKIISAAAALFLMLPSKVTFALDSFPAKCDAALAKDTLAVSTDDEVTLSVLRIIDQTNFVAYKQEFGGSVTLPIHGVPFKFGADWGTFNQNRTSFFEKNHYYLNQKMSHSITTARTPEKAYV